MTSLRLRPRLLEDRDLPALRTLVMQQPVVNCVALARIDAVNSLDPVRFGALVWGLEDPENGGLRGALLHGGNLIPIGTNLPALSAIAAQVAQTARACSSIVGTSDGVEAIWPVLSAAWGAPRAVRGRQPLLMTDRLPPVAPDPAVRGVRSADFAQFLPAAVAMFSEELGISPLGGDGGAAYRARVRELIYSGRSFARFGPDGRVEFKAEIGALSAHTAQLQGIWVRPDLRGQGLGTAATAALVGHALAKAPTVSLYVNDYNRVARRMYARLGLHEITTLATVLF